ncbi:MAG: hypothetical protein WB767_15740 [Nocardioides sp.]
MTATTMPDHTTTAPVAPGTMGAAPEPAELQRYLGELEAWVRARRHELAELDTAALGSGHGVEVASDMALSLAVWKAVSDRYALVFATWDGGRVLQSERELIASLIWGRLDGASEMPNGLAVSLPEACRLSDALAGQLRAKISLAPGAAEAAAHINDLRAQLERIRDQVGLEPALGRDAVVDRLAGLMARLQVISERASRGADVGGMLAPLEQEASVFERDLIVGNARRRDARDQVLSARELRADLEQRATALVHVAEQCVSTVDPAPRLAIPDVTLLGPVPNTPEAIGPYLERLDRVGQAMSLAQDRYAEALSEHAELIALLDGYTAKARALGLATGDLADSERRAREVLARRPAPMAVCRQLVSTYQAWLAQLTQQSRSGKDPS